MIFDVLCSNLRILLLIVRTFGFQILAQKCHDCARVCHFCSSVRYRRCKLILVLMIQRCTCKSVIRFLNLINRADLTRFDKENEGADENRLNLQKPVAVLQIF